MRLQFSIAHVAAALITILLLAGCDGGDARNPGTDTVADLAISPDTDSRVQPSDEPCAALFGRPAATTGLSDDQCTPSCDCEGVLFEAPVYSEEEIAALEALVLSTPMPALEDDPYEHPGDHPLEPEKACGILFDTDGPGSYGLQTYETPAAALEAGAAITHHGACGLCSSLVNLGVYIRNNDLAGPVRQCGIDHAMDGQEHHIECLMNLGFDLPCAQIWYRNTKHTQAECFLTCMENLEKPYHNEDGSLNDCIQCDEDLSGVVFKAVSGRTRRNSGLPTALCRPCASVSPVVHRY